MYDQHSLFCLFFFVFSYKLLFWSDRSISIGALVLTLCCALSITQLFYPHDPLVSFGHLGETLHNTSPSFRVMADTAWRRSWDYVDKVHSYFHK